MPVELSPKFNANKPLHVAFIMDGNGRWAQRRFLPRSEGHRAGAKTVRMVIEECRKIGIRHVTLFALSTENWKRPKDEVSFLMKLFQKHLISELGTLEKNDIRFRCIGRRTLLPTEVVTALENVEERTRNLTGMDLTLAISYGGRQEITDAARQIANKVASGELSPDEITEETFGSCLYAPDVPDPEILIRTSNELRISNFLLWQLAYSEIIVSEKLWPEFGKDDLYQCLNQYAGRTRKFGLTAQQVKGVA